MFLRSDTVERRLAQAKARLKAAVAALAPKHKGGEWEEFHTARNEVLRLEREVANGKGLPFAVPSDFPYKWDAGAPLPILLSSDDRTFLTFIVSDPDPGWDGTYTNIVDPSSEKPIKLCLVTFNNCVSAKLGHPNDEAQPGHYLSGHGLEGYTAQIVKNSPWLQEVAKTNSLHPCNNPDRWNRLHHFIFWFHDSTFECLAESCSAELSTEPVASLLNRVQSLLLRQ